MTCTLKLYLKKDNVISFGELKRLKKNLATYAPPIIIVINDIFLFFS